MRFALLAVLLAGCDGEPVGPDDTAAVLGVACTVQPDRFTDIEAALTDIPTVARVTWGSETVGTGQVAFTFGEGDVLTSADTAGTTHTTLIRGVPPDTEVTWRLVLTDDEGTWCSDAQTITTGLPPATLPPLTVSSLDPEQGSGAFVPISLLSREERQVFTAILDSRGRYVWFQDQSDFRYRVMVSADHTAILSNTQAGSSDAIGHITRTGFDGEVIRDVEVVGGHTDFAELPDGTLTTLAWDLREYEDGTRRILGDRLIEIAPDGTQTEIWSIFDDVEPDLSVVYDSGWDDPSSGNEDWSHANGLTYDPEADAYYITFFQFEAVARVDRGTGTLTWMLSPRDDTFTSTTEPFPVSNPHSVQALDADTLLVFNRGWFGPGECSEAVELTVDADAATVTRDWSFATEDCLQVLALGDARRLPNGNTFVAFSFSGELDEVTPDGDVVWRVNSELGEAFGFSDPTMSLY